jgi:hypothetical protein
VTGPLVIAAGLFVFAHIPVDGSYVRNLLPGFILLGLGAGMSFVASTIAATSGVPLRESGLASGLLNTSQQIGGSLGLAILTGVSASAARRYLQGNSHPNLTAAQAIPAATVHGFNVAYYVGMGIALAASLVAFLVIDGKAHRRSATNAAPAVAAH